MRKLHIIIAVLVSLSLLAITTQALAGPGSISVSKVTPGPHGKSGERGNSGEHGNSGQQGNPAHGKKGNWRGVITFVDCATLTVDTGGSSFTNFVLTPDTQVRIGSMHSGSCLDLVAGQKVMVQARDDGQGTLTALVVRAIPGKPTKVHRVGVVTEYVPATSITILAHDGNLYTFLLSADTKILPTERAGELAVGRLVTIIARRYFGAGPWPAQGIVVHPEGVPGAFATLTPTATSTPTETPTPTPSPTETPTGSPTP